MKMPLISFIIPVYNAQWYLEECLASILMQTRKDYEVILIDDCSQDRSGTICDIYAQKYEAIKVIHLTENQGPGGARNIGLTKAKGKYIHFMDSDDLIARNFVENIIEVIQYTDVDVLHIQHECIAADDTLSFESLMFVIEKESTEQISSDEACERLIVEKNLRIGVWQFVIKRDLLIQKHIVFPPTYYGEDMVVYLKVVLAAHNLIFLQGKYYLYRMNTEGALTQRVSEKEKEIFLSCVNATDHLLECEAYTEKQKRLQENFVKRCFGESFRLLYCLQEDEEVLRSVEVLLEKNQDYFKKHSHDIALSTLIQEYGVHDGLMWKLHSLNEALENATNFYKKPYIFIMPASKPNVAVAKRLEKCGACVKGYLDNNPQTAQKVISNNGSVYSPAILQEISSKEDIAIIISSSRDEVEQALVKQMKEEYLLDDIQLFCLK